jgi:hypothetical protein
MEEKIWPRLFVLITNPLTKSPHLFKNKDRFTLEYMGGKQVTRVPE